MMSVESINKLITFSIVSGFICNAFLTQYIPELRIFFIAIALVLGIYKLSSYFKHKITIYVTIITFLLILFYKFYYIYIGYNTDNPYLYCIILGLLLSDNIEFLKKILSYVLVINIILMYLEFINGEYLINIVDANKFELGRYQGLFSYSKETSFFLVITFLLFRFLDMSMIYRIIFFISSIFTGSRTSMLFIFFIIIIDLIIKTEIKKILSKYVLKYILIICTNFLLFYYFVKPYFIDNLIILDRIINSFNTQSSGHVDRYYFFSRYIDQIKEFNIIEFLLGKGNYIARLVGNGSENTWLTLISETGLIGFLIYAIPLAYLSILSIFNFYKFYPFILLIMLMMFGRIGLGWADGIILWCIIFYSIYIKNITYEKSSNNLPIISSL